MDWRFLGGMIFGGMIGAGVTNLIMHRDWIFTDPSISHKLIALVVFGVVGVVATIFL